jgi:hypothetical protein
MMEMATVQLSTFNRDERNPMPAADGVCITAAMFGGAAGALSGAAVVGSSFEYAAVLFGTLGVVMGSIIAGTAGRYVIAPVWQALSCRHN